MKRIYLLAAAAAATLVAAPAMAHNAWIKPSATLVSGEDGWVTFDAAASTDVYNADHQPMGLEMIKAYTPAGAEVALENGMRGRYRSTFDLHLTEQGTYRVGIESLGVTGTYMLDGQEYRVGGRRGPPPGAGAPAGGPVSVPGGADFSPPANATDVKLSLSGNRNDVFVTLGNPTEIRTTGQGLEMVPVTHPADLVADEAGQFRFLVDGKPAAGLEVEVVPDGRRFRNDQGAITAVTDADGVATIEWTGAGLYWLHTAYEDEATPRAGITGRRFQYTANLEVMAP